MYYKLKEHNAPPSCFRELDGFNPREREVLECVYKFSLFAYSGGRQFVATFFNRDRALICLDLLKMDGGRAGIYAIRQSTSGDWYCHITPDLCKLLARVDEPELEQMNTGRAWLPIPKKPRIRL